MGHTSSPPRNHNIISSSIRAGHVTPPRAATYNRHRDCDRAYSNQWRELAAVRRQILDGPRPARHSMPGKPNQTPAGCSLAEPVGDGAGVEQRSGRSARRPRVLGMTWNLEARMVAPVRLAHAATIDNESRWCYCHRRDQTSTRERLHTNNTRVPGPAILRFGVNSILPLGPASTQKSAPARLTGNNELTGNGADTRPPSGRHAVPANSVSISDQKVASHWDFPPQTGPPGAISVGKINRTDAPASYQRTDNSLNMDWYYSLLGIARRVSLFFRTPLATVWL